MDKSNITESKEQKYMQSLNQATKPNIYCQYHYFLSDTIDIEKEGIGHKNSG